MEELEWRRKVGHDEHANIVSRALYPIANIFHEEQHTCGAQAAVVEDNGTRICLGCGERSVADENTASQ